MAYVIGSPEHKRAAEVRSYLDRNRRNLRALAIARCGEDNRLLAATYRLRDGYWLWAVGERSTPAETLEHACDWHEARYFDALIDGVDPAEAEKLLWQPDGTEVIHSDQYPPSVQLLRDPVGVYRSMTWKDVQAQRLYGPFASCVKCRRTVVIGLVAMEFMTGMSIMKGGGEKFVVLI